MQKILIIERDKHIQDVFKITLNSFGYSVACITDGASLLRLKDNWPDVIILDHQFPGLNVVEICRTLKTLDEFHHIPVLITSNAVQHVEQSAKPADFREKPSPLHLMLKKVTSLLLK